MAAELDMEQFVEFASILSSSVVAGLVAALVAFRSGERRIQIENITQERAKWRDKIRTIALEVHKAACASDKNRLAELHLQFAMNLNPTDNEDQAILFVIGALGDQDTREERLAEFSDRVALLLKHDWQRAKLEVKPWFLRWRAPKRICYERFRVSSAAERRPVEASHVPAG